ncbi:MAG: LapA family protein [Pseudomonadota bacterium]|nr:LapA family protein [Pseudomonadota bacterium]
MQIVRTIIWVLILVGLLAFSFFNWDTVEVTLWDNLILETKIPALVIIAFLMGLVPMWAYHRSVKWSLNRRIRSLENAARSNALQARHDPAETPDTVGKPVDKPAESAAKTGDTLTPAVETRTSSSSEIR